MVLELVPHLGEVTYRGVDELLTLSAPDPSIRWALLSLGVAFLEMVTVG